MPGATTAAPTQGGQTQQSAPTQAFPEGTYEYSEVLNTTTIVPGAATTEVVVQLNPGGYLRGVSWFVSSTGGALGGGAATADNPWCLIYSATLESIDGTSLKYPMGGYAYYLEQKFCRPWDGDPSQDPAFAAGANPAFRLRFFIESRGTLGVVPNTDARAQYRLRYTVNTLASLISGGAPTAPTVTIVTCSEIYAQPPAQSLMGAAIAQVPDGVTIQRFTSHQIDLTTSATQTIKTQRTGNLVRNFILVFRDASGNRTDLTGDPIRWRLDNTQLLVEQRQRRDYEANRFWSDYRMAAAIRPTGVYPYPRWHQPGQLQGMWWLETTEATFVQWEITGAVASGTMETIIEDLAPMGPVPSYLNGV